MQETILASALAAQFPVPKPVREDRTKDKVYRQYTSRKGRHQKYAWAFLGNNQCSMRKGR